MKATTTTSITTSFTTLSIQYFLIYSFNCSNCSNDSIHTLLAIAVIDHELIKNDHGVSLKKSQLRDYIESGTYEKAENCVVRLDYYIFKLLQNKIVSIYCIHVSTQYMNDYTSSMNVEVNA